MAGPSHDPSLYRDRDVVPVKRALVSVSDKTGLLPLAEALASYINDVLRHRRDEVTIMGPPTETVGIPIIRARSRSRSPLDAIDDALDEDTLPPDPEADALDWRDLV